MCAVYNVNSIISVLFFVSVGRLIYLCGQFDLTVQYNNVRRPGRHRVLSPVASLAIYLY